jgi:hypothetical protein
VIAQSGQGSGLGQISWNPNNSGPVIAQSGQGIFRHFHLRGPVIAQSRQGIFRHFHLRGPVIAQSGQGSGLGQISWNPNNSGALKCKRCV